MAEIILRPRLGLEHLAVAGRCGKLDGDAGVTLSLGDGGAFASVICRKGRRHELAQRVQRAFGLEMPASPRRTDAGGIAFVWSGPDQWLAMAAGLTSQAFEQRLRDELAGLASVCEQSDGRVLIRISGARARETLAKGMMIDLHRRAFRPNDAAVTGFAHIPAYFWQVDSAPTYEFAVFRSLAAEFWHSLVEAGGEFGVMIEANTSQG